MIILLVKEKQRSRFLNETIHKKTRSSAKKLEDARKELEEAYALEQGRYVQEIVNVISNAAEHQQSKVVWETVNQFIGRKGTNRGIIKAKSQEDRIRKWKNHLLNLLGQSPVITPKPTKTIVQQTLLINTNNFSMEQLRRCVKGFTNNKAPGLDNIPIEVWKSNALNTQLLESCNNTLNGDKRETSVMSRIVPLPKKGDLGNTGNYRGISLAVTAAKIYNNMSFWKE